MNDTGTDMQRLKMDYVMSGQSAPSSHHNRDAIVKFMVVGIGGLTVGAVAMLVFHVTLGEVRRRRAMAQMASPVAVEYIELARIGSHSPLLQEKDEVECETPGSS